MNLNSQMEMRALSLLGTPQMATLADWLPLDNQKVDWQPVINTIGQAMNQADEQKAARLRHSWCEPPAVVHFMNHIGGNQWRTPTRD